MKILRVKKKIKITKIHQKENKTCLEQLKNLLFMGSNCSACSYCQKNAEGQIEIHIDVDNSSKI